MTTLDGVLVDDHPARSGVVRVVALDRPEQRNALDLQIRIALAEALEKAMADPAVRAIVLTGTGGHFCAGGDTSTMARTTPEQIRPRLESAQRVVRAIFAGPTPVVAAVEGYAIGAGLGMALACDRVVVAENAHLRTAFTRVGLVGDLGVFWSLPRRVGPARARQLLLFGDGVSGTQAVEWGMADAVAKPGTALEVALADGHRLADGPPLALAAVKRMLDSGPRELAAILDREADEQAAAFDTADFAEGVAALRERRQPEFGGA